MKIKTSIKFKIQGKISSKMRSVFNIREQFCSKFYPEDCNLRRSFKFISYPEFAFKQQSGVVIIVALFIVALVSAMAVTMMSRLERDTRRTTLIARQTQAAFYAEGSVAWARDQLRKDWEKQTPNRPIDKMPFVTEEANVNGYRINSTITDMQGRFNINNLSNPDSQENFLRLLTIVDPKMKPETANQIAKAIFDWIMPLSQENEFSQYYSHLPSPYRAAHRPMTHISELRLVKGMTASLYQRLEPYVIALPQPTPINIQTAEAPVLMMLSGAMKLETAKSIIKFRQEMPLLTTQIFLSLDMVQNLNISSEKITTVSSYFLLKTVVSIENQQLVLYTLLERLANQKKAVVNIIWQSKGVA